MPRVVDREPGARNELRGLAPTKVERRKLVEFSADPTLAALHTELTGYPVPDGAMSPSHPVGAATR